MSYTTDSGRRQILDDASAAAAPISYALDALGDIYDDLEEHLADHMEADLFKPLQQSLSLLRRTLGGFAGRVDLPAPVFESGPAQLPEEAHEAFEHVAEAAEDADGIIAELQDTLLPVEVGDRELRAGLSGVRKLLTPLPAACDEFLRVLGR